MIWTAEHIEQQITGRGGRVTLGGLIDGQTCASVLGAQYRTLQSWGDEGPPFTKIHGKRWYRLDEIADWLNARRRNAQNRAELTMRTVLRTGRVNA